MNIYLKSFGSAIKFKGFLQVYEEMFEQKENAEEKVRIQERNNSIRDGEKIKNLILRNCKRPSILQSLRQDLQKVL